jgi:hypothetical protein
MPTCPTCELPTHEDVENDEIELTYKKHGKLLNYTHGWTACPRCLIGAIVLDIKKGHTNLIHVVELLYILRENVRDQEKQNGHVTRQ